MLVLSAQSFVGVFSYMDIFLDDPIYKGAWMLYAAIGAMGLVAIRAIRALLVPK